jgi:hypothetical protein
MDLKKIIAFFFTEKILPFNQGFFYYQALRIVERCCPTDSSCLNYLAQVITIMRRCAELNYGLLPTKSRSHLEVKSKGTIHVHSITDIVQ